MYAVGHGGLAREGRWMAAVLACGESSALSHRSGAALLDLDLGAILAAEDLARAVERSQILRLFDLATLDDVIDRARGHRGAGALRRALSSYLPEHEELRSRLERRMLGVCAAASVPAPVPNAPIELVDGTVVVDFLWTDHALVVETDGWQTHGPARRSSATEAATNT